MCNNILKSTTTEKCCLLICFSLLVLQIFSCNATQIKDSSSSVDELLSKAINLHQDGRFLQAKQMYLDILEKQPMNADAHHLLGLIQHHEGEIQLAQTSILNALKLRPEDSVFLTNYGALLVELRDYEEAEAVLRMALQENFEYNPALYNIAFVLQEAGKVAEAEKAYLELLQREPLNEGALVNLALMYDSQRRYEDAAMAWEVFFQTQGDPKVPDLMHYGVALQHIGKLGEASTIYRQVLMLDPSNQMARLNLLAAMQEEGLVAEAVEQLWPFYYDDPENIYVLNNLGTGLLHTLDSRGVELLEKVIQLDPENASKAMINLATYFSEEGELERALVYYQRVYQLDEEHDGLPIRMAVLVPPIMLSRQAIQESRHRFKEKLLSLHSQHPPLQINHPVKSVDRVHFYLVYHGYNDRHLQELVTSLYWKSAPGLLYLAPHLQSSDAATIFDDMQGTPTEKIQVGFCSRFFGPYEPHGLLLRGIMAGLPREDFEVSLFWVSGSHLDEGIAQAVHKVVKLSPTYEEARRQLAQEKLDVLVYADMMSEPMTHFLGYARLAKVQCVFWGNPITSGNPNIDYFISADRMEPSNRTEFTQDDEPYTEQVVLLDGQGIWYDRPTNLPARLPREAYGLQEGWLVYLCAQSLFKLHPDYDGVLAAIMRQVPHAHLVFTEGRRGSWTRRFRERLLGSFPDLQDRIHFVERQPPGDAFLQLLLTGDVILHPFPFGGSRTSAEGLSLGIPVVAMRTNFLRGRMAASFYDSMGMQDFVAESADKYIETAVRLGIDQEYRAKVSSRIRNNVDTIWEDAEVVSEWTRFLYLASGRQPLSGRTEQQPLAQDFLEEIHAAASTLFDEGKYQEAIDILEYVTSEEIPNSNLLTLLAACYLQKGDSSQAFTIYEDLVQLDPDAEEGGKQVYLLQ